MPAPGNSPDARALDRAGRGGSGPRAAWETGDRGEPAHGDWLTQRDDDGDRREGLVIDLHGDSQPGALFDRDRGGYFHPHHYPDRIGDGHVNADCDRHVYSASDIESNGGRAPTPGSQRRRSDFRTDAQRGIGVSGGRRA